MARPKAFISPSTQEKNLYTTGGNEEYYMRIVASMVAERLLKTGAIDVLVGGAISAAANVAAANAWGADSYTALHTNAAGGKGAGTVAFGWLADPLSVALSNEVYKRVAAVSPGADYGLRSGAHLIEVNGPRMAATLIELEFHDTVVGSNHIKNNLGLYATAIADGILAYHKITPVAPVPVPEYMICMAHGAVADMGLYAGQALTGSDAFWFTTVGTTVGVGRTVTDGLRDIADKGTPAKKVFGEGLGHAVFAVHCTSAEADAFVKLAKALNDAVISTPVPRLPADGKSHYTSLVNLLERGKG